MFECNVQKEVAELSTTCERHIGTQSGAMDQSISVMAERGVAKLIDLIPSGQVMLYCPRLGHLLLQILSRNRRK
jgi:N-acetylgalactosamine kinase